MRRLFAHQTRSRSLRQPRAQYLDVGDFNDPAFQQISEVFHGGVASDHRIMELRANPTRACMARGSVFPDWKHWAYPFLIRGMFDGGLLPVKSKILVLGDANGPLHGYLSSLYQVCALDPAPVQETGILRQHASLTRIFRPPGLRFPFDDGFFDAALVLERPPSSDDFLDLARVLKPTAPLCAVLDVGTENSVEQVLGTLRGTGMDLPRVLPMELVGEMREEYQKGLLAALPGCGRLFMGVTL